MAGCVIWPYCCNRPKIRYGSRAAKVGWRLPAGRVIPAGKNPLDDLFRKP